MYTSWKGTLVVGTLSLALTVVLAGCGGGGSGGSSSASGQSSSTGKVTTSGEATTGGSSGGAGKYGAASSAATSTTKGASSKSASSKHASGGVLKTIVIEETEFQLSPSKVTLGKPGTYAFKAENKGSAEHNLEIDGEGVKGEGGETGEARLEQNLQPGQSSVLRVTFKESGTFEMYCPIIGHRLAGMKGTVVVE